MPPVRGKSASRAAARRHRTRHLRGIGGCGAHLVGLHVPRDEEAEAAIAIAAHAHRTRCTTLALQLLEELDARSQLLLVTNAFVRRARVRMRADCVRA
eukprot:scaffold820_cov376-Prasinococcus_capsulatus_cf.AAC.18